MNRCLFKPVQAKDLDEIVTQLNFPKYFAQESFLMRLTDNQLQDVKDIEFAETDRESVYF